MRGSITIEGKTYYAYESGSKAHCQQIAKALREQGRKARVRQVGRRYTIYALPRLHRT